MALNFQTSSSEAIQLEERRTNEDLRISFQQIEEEIDKRLETYETLPFHNIKHAKKVRSEMREMLENVTNDELDIDFSLHKPNDLSRLISTTRIDLTSSEYADIAQALTEEIDTIPTPNVQRAYALLLAQAHDLIQEGEINTTTGQLQRERVYNEIQSAIEFYRILQNHHVFKNIGFARILRDTITTIPKVAYSEQEGLKVSQRFIQEATLIGKMLALADLSSASAGTFEEAKEPSDAEFWELNLQLAQDISENKLSTAEKIAAIKKMYNWAADHKDFIKWRKILTQKITSTIDNQAIKKKYAPEKFDINIQNALNREKHIQALINQIESDPENEELISNVFLMLKKEFDHPWTN